MFRGGGTAKYSSCDEARLQWNRFTSRTTRWCVQTLISLEPPPPSCRNGAMRLPQPRLGQYNSASSNSRRDVPIATANKECSCRTIFFICYCCDCACFRDYVHVGDLIQGWRVNKILPEMGWVVDSVVSTVIVMADVGRHCLYSVHRKWCLCWSVKWSTILSWPVIS